MAYQLMMTRAQIERIIRALKAAPEPCDAINPDSSEGSGPDVYNLQDMAGTLDYVLGAPEDDGTLHGVCL